MVYTVHCAGFTASVQGVHCAADVQGVHCTAAGVQGVNFTIKGCTRCALYSWCTGVHCTAIVQGVHCTAGVQGVHCTVYRLYILQGAQ